MPSQKVTSTPKSDIYPERWHPYWVPSMNTAHVNQITSTKEQLGAHYWIIYRGTKKNRIQDIITTRKLHLLSMGEVGHNYRPADWLRKQLKSQNITTTPSLRYRRRWSSFLQPITRRTRWISHWKLLLSSCCMPGHAKMRPVSGIISWFEYRKGAIKGAINFSRLVICHFSPWISSLQCST